MLKGDTMKKRMGIVVAAVTFLLFFSSFWNRNHILLRNAEVDAFCDQLMQKHPKIEKTHAYLYDGLLEIQLFYDDSNIPEEELLEIRDEVKGRFDRPFIQAVAKAHWGNDGEPADCYVPIFLSDGTDFSDRYAYLIRSTLTEKRNNQQALDDADNLFRHWDILLYSGEIFAKDAPKE